MADNQILISAGFDLADLDRQMKRFVSSFSRALNDSLANLKIDLSKLKGVQNLTIPLKLDMTLANKQVKDFREQLANNPLKIATTVAVQTPASAATKSPATTATGPLPKVSGLIDPSSLLNQSSIDAATKSLAQFRTELSKEGATQKEVTKLTQQFETQLNSLQKRLDQVNRAQQIRGTAGLQGPTRSGLPLGAPTDKELFRLQDGKLLVDKYSNAIGNLSVQQSRAGIEAERTTHFMESFGFKVGILGFGLGILGGTLQNVSQAMFGFIQSSAKATESLERVTNLVQQFQEQGLFSKGEGAAVLDRLNKISDLPGANLERVVKSFRSLANLNIGIERSLHLIEGLTKATALSGTGAEGIERLTEQLRQFVTSGKLTERDIRTISEQGGVKVTDALNQAFGSTSARVLQEAGPIAVIDAIITGLEDIPTPLRTTSDILNIINNSWTRMQASINVIIRPGLEAMTGTLKSLESSVHSLRAGFEELSPGTQTFISGFVVALPIIATVAAALLTSLSALAILLATSSHLTSAWTVAVKALGKASAFTFADIGAGLTNVGSKAVVVGTGITGGLLTSIRSSIAYVRSLFILLSKLLPYTTGIRGLFLGLGSILSKGLGSTLAGLGGVFAGLARILGLTNPIGILINLIIAFITDFGRFRTNIVEPISGLATSIGGLIASLTKAQAAGTGLGKVLNFILGVVKVIITVFEVLFGVLGSVIALIINASANVIDLFTNISEALSGPSDQLFANILKALKIFALQGALVLKKFIYDIYISILQGGITLFNALPTSLGLADQLETNVAGLIEYRESLNDVKFSVNATTGEIEKLSNKLTKLDETQRKVVVSAEDVNKRMRQMARESRSASEELDKLVDRQGKQNFQRIGELNVEAAAVRVTDNVNQVDFLVDNFNKIAASTTNLTVLTNAYNTALNGVLAVQDQIADSSLTDPVFVSTIQKSLSSITQDGGLVEELRKKSNAPGGISAEERSLVDAFTRITTANTSEAINEELANIRAATTSSVFIQAIDVALTEANRARNAALNNINSSLTKAKTELPIILARSKQATAGLLRAEAEALQGLDLGAITENTRNRIADLERQVEEGILSVEAAAVERKKLETEILRAEAGADVIKLRLKLATSEVQNNAELTRQVQLQITSRGRILQSAIGRSNQEINRTASRASQSLKDSLKSTLNEQLKSLSGFLGDYKQRFAQVVGVLLNPLQRPDGYSTRPALLAAAELSEKLAPKLKAQFNAQFNDLFLVRDKLEPDDLAEQAKRVKEFLFKGLLAPLSAGVDEVNVELQKLLSAKIAGGLSFRLRQTISRQFLKSFKGKLPLEDLAKLTKVGGFSEEDLIQKILNGSKKELEIITDALRSGLSESDQFKLDEILTRQQTRFNELTEAQKDLNLEFNNLIQDALFQLQSQEIQTTIDEATTKLKQADLEKQRGSYKNGVAYYDSLKRLTVTGNLAILELEAYYNLQKKLNEETTIDEIVALKKAYFEKLKQLTIDSNKELADLGLAPVNTPVTPTEVNPDTKVTKPDIEINDVKPKGNTSIFQQLTDAAPPSNKDDTFTEGLNRTSQAYDKVFGSATQAAEAMLAYQDKLVQGKNIQGAFIKLLDGTGSALDLFGQVAVSVGAAAGQALGQMFISFLEGGGAAKTFTEALGSLLIALGEMLIQISIAAVVTSFLSNIQFGFHIALAEAAATVPWAALGVALGAGLIIAGGLMGGSGSQSPAKTSATNVGNSTNSATGARGADFDPNKDPRTIFQKALMAQITIDIKTDDTQIVKTVIKHVNQNTRLTKLIGNRKLQFGY